jgi:hypothetical protein
MNTSIVQLAYRSTDVIMTAAVQPFPIVRANRMI